MIWPRWATNISVRKHRKMATHMHTHTHPYYFGQKGHTLQCADAHLQCTCSWGFGVQRMFYFGNGFGLVTLLRWQTEKQVACKKHTTSAVTQANTLPPTHTHSHAQTQTQAHALTSLVLLLIPRSISPKGECVVQNVQADFSFSRSLKLFRQLCRKQYEVVFGFH